DGVVSLPALRLEAGSWKLEAGSWKLEAGKDSARMRSRQALLLASSFRLQAAFNPPATAPAGFESAAAEDRHPPAATTRSCAPTGRAAGRPTGRPARGVRRLHRSFPASAPWDAAG